MSAPVNSRIWVMKLTGTAYDETNLGLFSNSPAFIGSYPSLPIIKSLDGFSVSMGDYLPSFTGSIVLDNTPYSLGESRFSDLLTDTHRQTLINVRFRLYYLEVSALSTTSFSLSSLSLFGEYNIDNFNFDELTVTLNCSRSLIANTPITRQVPIVTGYGDAPSGSYSQYLPLIFGTGVWTPLVPMSGDYSYNGISTVRNNAPISAINGYSVFDSVYNTWVSFNPCPSATYSWYNEATSGGASYVDIHNSIEILYKLGRHSVSYTLAEDKATIITSVVVPVRFEVTIPTGEIIVKIVRVTPSGTVGSVLGTGRGKFSDQTAVIGVKNIEIFFDKPVIHDGVTDHYLSVAFANTTVANVSSIRYSGTLTTGFYQDANTKTYYTSTTVSPIEFQCYGIRDTKYLDYTTFALDSDGNGASGVRWTQRTAPTGQTETSIVGVQMAANINGITDGTGGDITGSANSLLTQARHIFKYFSLRYTGQKFDVLSTTTALTTVEQDIHVNIAGAFRGAYFMRQAIDELCRQSRARINYVSTGNGVSDVAVGYPSFFETAKISVATITDDNALFVSASLIGQETQVNRFRMSYFAGASYKSTLPPYETRSLLDWYYNKDYLTSAISTTSYTRYGNKYINDEDFALIGTSADALKVARKIAKRFAFPSLLCQFEVPFSEFKSVRVLDLLEVLHSSVPYSFGGSTKTLNPSYTGTEVDLAKGRPWRRAKRYRAEVESIELLYNENTTAKLRLTVRLITSPTDPT